MAATAAVLGLGSATQGATIYTYTPTNASTTWSSGTGWSPSSLVSSASNTLTFVGSNSTALASGLTNTNTDDITGAFQANGINLQGTGPASGAATINIAAALGSSLDLVNNVGTNPVIYLNANAGGAGLAYNVSAPITVSSSATSPSLTLAGTGTAAFNFSGGIAAGNASLTDTAQGTVTLNGATNTFLGGLNLSPSAGTETVNQTGGTVNTGPVVVGSTASSVTATYNLNGGTWLRMRFIR